MIQKITGSPLLVRVVPFAVFIVLTACQSQFGEAGRYWVYLAKTLAGAAMLWAVRPFIAEMKWKISWEAVAVGVGVCVMWIGLDTFYPSLDALLKYAGLGGKETKPALDWNPLQFFVGNAALAWFFIAVRLLGSALIVPPLEEVFFRSFLYRWIAKPDFENEPLGKFAWKPFLLTALIFGLEHQQWLAGILCGFAYQGLVIRKKRLGDAMTAHAITNFLLGVWVVWKGAWQFW